jgi:hypothetical protein
MPVFLKFNHLILRNLYEINDLRIGFMVFILLEKSHHMEVT